MKVIQSNGIIMCPNCNYYFVFFLLLLSGGQTLSLEEKDFVSFLNGKTGYCDLIAVDLGPTLIQHLSELSNPFVNYQSGVEKYEKIRPHSVCAMAIIHENLELKAKAKFFTSLFENYYQKEIFVWHKFESIEEHRKGIEEYKRTMVLSKSG